MTIVNVNPIEWGYHLWLLMYIAAENNDEEFFRGVPNYIPCDDCSSSFAYCLKVRKYSPVKKSLTDFLTDYHKEVCIKLNKEYKKPDYSNLKLIYKSLMLYLHALQISFEGSLINEWRFIQLIVNNIQKKSPTDKITMKYYTLLKSFVPITKPIKDIHQEISLQFDFGSIEFKDLSTYPRLCCGGRRKVIPW